MINVKELRVGNWVNHKAEWSAESPKSVSHIFQWTDWHFYCIHESTLSYEVVEPIPLTPEILEKCGFTTKNGQYFSFMNWDLRKTNTGTYIHESDWREIGGYMSSLHELQNLYFALNGAELNYQP